jgi:hypothetical protein
MSKTIADVAKALGCKVDGAKSRLVALGYVKTCSRCGGSGRYSFNLMDGDRCFGCSGSGKQMMPITAKLVADAKARQDAGELDAYFARNRARAAAKAQIAPLVAEARAIYETIGDAYTRAGKVGWNINDALCRAQTMNNSLFWGAEKAEVFTSDGVKDVEYRVQHGREDAVRAVAVIRERIADLTALRDAAAPHLESWIASPKVREAA